MSAPLEVWIAKMQHWKQNTYPAISLTSFATPLASLQRNFAKWWWLYFFGRGICFVAFYIGPSSQDDLIVMPDLLLMLYMVSMLSMPPHATRLPLGEKAEVITHADFRGITYVMKHKVLRFYNTWQQTYCQPVSCCRSRNPKQSTFRPETRWPAHSGQD